MGANTTETWNFSLTKTVPNILGAKLYEVKDERNDILSHYTDLFSWDSYINYLKTLQSSSSKWVSYGYFDIGMVPFAMAPIFKIIKTKGVEYMWVSEVSQFAVEYISRKLNIPYFKKDPVSFMRNTKFTNGAAYDVWVRREDICKAIGFNGNPLQFSIINYLEGEGAKAWEIHRARQEH